MSNTNQDSHKGKEKVNEEPITNSQTMENPNKRKTMALKDEPNAETKNSKSPRNNAGVDESTSSSKEFSPFLLFGFIIDPSKGYQKAYSCAFCRRKFVSPQALSGKQNCQECEESLRRVVEALNKPRDNLYYGVQGMRLSKIVPYTGGCGYTYGGNDAGKLQGPVLHNPQIDQNTVNGQVIRAEIDLNNDLVSEEASKNIDLNLMP
ncbi:uncharacterized protein LOC131614660 [Vicia villosa]|uniref:uncharacterized protein LOC131614660 n=1 Tax=Vicia villosa TaxID=3911 RepID=UPI00273BBC75|nr:uncharacterized protein LOC131614660 [Vicia villosa]